MTPEQLADAIIGMFVDYEPGRHQARRAGTIRMIQDTIAAAEAAAYERAAQECDTLAEGRPPGIWAFAWMNDCAIGAAEYLAAAIRNLT